MTGATLISFGLVALNLVVLAVAGIVVNKLAFRGDQTAFIMELPLYHVPNGRTVGLYVWNNTVSFVKKAGTLILLASMVVWALSSFPGPGIDNSVLAAIGRSLEPIGQLMGLNDWRIIVALLTSFFAKENTIATLGILFNTDAESVTLAQEVALVLVPAARVAFLAVVMLFVPCSGNRCDDQAGDELVALDRRLYRADACAVAGRGHCHLSGGSVDRLKVEMFKVTG